MSIDDQRYAALTLQSLRVTIGPLQASTTSLESRESYLTAGMLPYNKNVTLQTFLSSTRDFYRLNSTFARLYNAAASPASRLRSAGSLAITWLVPRAGKMNQIARCDWLPERARWSHLARSGLPAVSRKQNFPKSHIINPLLTKFVRSRWLDIGLVLFLRVYGPRLRLGP